MLDWKLLELSRSRYNSPIFCVIKKNGSWRPVVDLRAINQATVKDFYAIRDIKSCIDEIGRERSTVFSSMDLSKGFFQQNLAEESRPYTSFMVPGLGSFQFTVSCFGSHGAPSSFSYLMTKFNFLYRRCISSYSRSRTANLDARRMFCPITKFQPKTVTGEVNIWGKRNRIFRVQDNR